MFDSCDPMDCALPGNSDLQISQAIILEWVAISFSGAEAVGGGGLPDPGIEPWSPTLQVNS